VQKIVAVRPAVKPRTLMMPCSAPLGLVAMALAEFAVADRQGRGSCGDSSRVKISTWPAAIHRLEARIRASRTPVVEHVLAVVCPSAVSPTGSCRNLRALDLLVAVVG